MTEIAVSESAAKECSEWALGFVRHISGLDRGRKAALRRNAGNTMAEARNVNWFYDILGQHRVRDWDEGVYFLVATLAAGDRDAQKSIGRHNGDLGVAMRRLATTSSSPDSVERRFGILLDAKLGRDGGGELAYRLRQTIKLLSAKGITIDWPVLLEDLLKWSKSGKPIQKKWARSFYSAPESISGLVTDTQTKHTDLEDEDAR